MLFFPLLHTIKILLRYKNIYIKKKPNRQLLLFTEYPRIHVWSVSHRYRNSDFFYIYFCVDFFFFSLIFFHTQEYAGHTQIVLSELHVFMGRRAHQEYYISTKSGTMIGFRSIFLFHSLSLRLNSRERTHTQLIIMDQINCLIEYHKLENIHVILRL